MERTDPYHGLQWETRESWQVESWEGSLDPEGRWLHLLISPGPVLDGDSDQVAWQGAVEACWGRGGGRGVEGRQEGGQGHHHLAHQRHRVTRGGIQVSIVGWLSTLFLTRGGKMCGSGRLILEDGSLLEGRLRDGCLHGLARWEHM